ncbi:MAG TPA: endopeptidase La [Ardenticatenaceae bacterium]|nr:endopeptidase La [Ardenticatenaceae bacterium]
MDDIDEMTTNPESEPIGQNGQASEGVVAPADEEGEIRLPEVLPILPLRNTVVYPLTVLPLSAENPRSIRLVDAAVQGNRLVGIVAMKDAGVETPGPNEVYPIGTVALIHRLLRAPDGSVRLIIQGLQRHEIAEWTAEEPFLMARIRPRPEVLESSVEVEALSRNLLDLFRRLVELVPHLPDELMMAAINAEDARQLVYLVATSIRMDVAEAQQILETDSVAEKLRTLTRILNRELDVLELGKKIQSDAQSEMERMQREYFLREQMKAIQKELGEESETEVVEEYRRRIGERGLSAEAREQALRELDRMARMPPQAAEYSVIKTYLDWLLDIPWVEVTEDNLDINHARQVLDEDHYDLEDIKERIIEYLAVRKLWHERYRERHGDEEPDALSDDEAPEIVVEEPENTGRGAILCLVGPPGVGKTSLGRSIARSLGRQFTRMSLGGVRDEAEIRGHRRTYIGAMPGRIMQSLKRAQVRNPVFMLDEIDKLGRDFRGDPTSALLEVLDPQQNDTFRDHYLDVDFDLSDVIFIATANLLEPVPPPLLDRMEVLELDGYTETEKVHIARNYLVPRQLTANALRKREVEFAEEALRRIIRDYTREAGVRNLEREIGRVLRKVATRVAAGERPPDETIRVEVGDVAGYLGKQKFYFEAADRTETPGVATGLAVTAVGGDILFIEATRMAGKKGLTLTGQLGEVMKESAVIAVSYVRANARRLGIDATFFDDNDIHIHVPAGAIPKDGPSAGVAMVTAIVSLLTRRPVRATVGMSGEITLRGQVLPIGGVKQKALAAHRAGLTTMILPKRNEPDLDELPPEVCEQMTFVLADHVQDALDAALSDPLPEPEERDGAGDEPFELTVETTEEAVTTI